MINNINEFNEYIKNNFDNFDATLIIEDFKKIYELNVEENGVEYVNNVLRQVKKITFPVTYWNDYLEYSRYCFYDEDNDMIFQSSEIITRYNN